MTDDDKVALAQSILHLILKQRTDLGTGGGILMGAFHALVDWHLAQSTKTHQEIRALKREIGQGMAEFLDAELNPDIYEDGGGLDGSA